MWIIWSLHSPPFSFRKLIRLIINTAENISLTDYRLLSRTNWENMAPWENYIFKRGTKIEMGRNCLHLIIRHYEGVKVVIYIYISEYTSWYENLFWAPKSLERAKMRNLFDTNKIRKKIWKIMCWQIIHRVHC